ncbi:hypothetical protein [Streptomyces werraensis]|uniref:hypothetical protein n=1 Tax=Streptomyces werraensis TaxID=68284 RepID=UPI001CE2BA0E
MRVYRDRLLTPEQRAAKRRQEDQRRNASNSNWRVQRDRAARRRLPCVVCGNSFERRSSDETGRIAKYCSTQCRSRRSRERAAGFPPGGIALFLRYLRVKPGQRANAEQFVDHYRLWCSVYGVEPLAPLDMLPELRAAGFAVEGSGADQAIVFNGL